MVGLNATSCLFAGTGSSLLLSLASATGPTDAPRPNLPKYRSPWVPNSRCFQLQMLNLPIQLLQLVLLFPLVHPLELEVALQILLLLLLGLLVVGFVVAGDGAKGEVGGALRRRRQLRLRQLLQRRYR